MSVWRRADHLAQQQHGVISRRQCLELGMFDTQVTRAARDRGPWQRVLPGIYAVTTGQLTQASLVAAAVLFGGPTSQVTGLVALSRNKQLVNECNDADGCEPDDYRDVRDTRDAMATTSTVMFAVGAAAATAGVIMLIMAPDDEAEAPVGEAEVAVTPAAGPGFTGIAVSGRF